MNRVVHGANEFSRNLTDWTVSRVKDVFRHELNCSYFAEAFIGGRPAPVSATLKPGQDLEFLKRFGNKSSGRGPRDIVEARRLLKYYPEVAGIVTDALGRGPTVQESDIAALVLQFCVEKFGTPTREVGLALEETARQISRHARNLVDGRITNAGLTDSERDIVAAVRDAKRRLTTMGVFDAMDKAGRPCGESTVKTLLSYLVRRGILNNCSRCNPRGYGLPEWPHRCGLDSVRTD